MSSKIMLCIYSLFFLYSYPNSGSAESFQDCGSNINSRILARMIIKDKDQKRVQLKCNLLLSKIANDKAKEMATLKRVAHVGRNPANKRLVEAGYPLAEIYPLSFENNVEAIAGGISDPQVMWQEFKESDVHKMHLLGEHEFYLLQNEIGVGFYYDTNTPHVEYWVIYIAHQIQFQNYEGTIAKSKD